MYEKDVRGNIMIEEDCIMYYKNAKDKYKEALKLSQHDEFVKHKILDVDRRLSALNI